MARKKAEMQAPVSPLARARTAHEQGNVRRARQLLTDAVSSGPEGEREEARRLLERTGPDPRALLAAAVALVLILIATWVAILHR